MSWHHDGALRKRYSGLEARYGEYFERQRTSHSGRTFDFMLEARSRLRQLVHIVSRLEDLQASRDGHTDSKREKWTEMEVYTEAFYWISFRLLKVVQHLPGLESYKSVGVRDVRNMLIQHPEGKASGITF